MNYNNMKINNEFQYKKYLKLRNWVNINKLDWNYLSENPNAIEFLERNPDKINWSNLSSNINNRAIEILLQNQDKIIWETLYWNENNLAIDINSL